MSIGISRIDDDIALKSKVDFTDSDLVVLVELHRGESLRGITGKLYKSLGMVQFYVRWLETNGYILKFKKGWRPYQITTKGKGVLIQHGYIPKDS